MEDITRSEEHLRSSNGKTLLNIEANNERVTSGGHKRWQTSEQTFWIAAASFICVFSVMVILLAVTMSGRSAMAAKLDDMTELYNYQTNIQQTTQQSNYAEPETVSVCGNCESSEPKAYYRVYRFTW